MTTRDPRSRLPHQPESGREPTASLSIEVDQIEQLKASSLAVGTHEANGDERTKIESPTGRNKPAAPRESRPAPAPPRNPDDPELRLGTQLGSYRLVELLGKGGMGYVYRAEHVKLGREVALKLLRADYARRRDAVLRFFQEAKTVNRVRHRNIVDVTDFVEIEDGTTFIIMEMLRGQSLGRWARTGIDMPRALAVLVQICDGLGAAHAVGVVHRDLKPDNVIVVPTSDGAELVKLLDFGVAKLLNRDDEDVGFQTAAGSVIGTPAYMSPEQAGGMAVDHRSDIYSLGAIMYELFCGQPMFRGRSFGEFVRKHLTENPVMPRQTQGGAHIDPRLEALIMRSLAKDPNERFSHILELRDGLLHMLGAVDTHPPGYVSMASSALRPLSSLLPGVPLPAPIAAVNAPTPTPHQSSVVHSGQLHPSLLYPNGLVPSGYSQVQPPVAATPFWVWLIGGACAVAIGVAAAVWYAGRTEGTGLQAAQHPVGTPIEQTPKLQQLELRFDSLPAAGVFADGHSAELCHTPCTYNVDLRDGGAVDRRTFVVRAEGYKDSPIVVDLAGAQHEFGVTLDRLPPATGLTPTPQAVEPEKTDKTPDKTDKTPDKTDKTPDKTDKTPDKTESQHTSTLKHGQKTKRGGDKKSTDKTPDKTDKTPDKTDKIPDKTAITLESTKPVGQDPDKTDKTPDKADKVPDKTDKIPDKTGPKKPEEKTRTIDPTETLDPFHRHK